MSCLALPRNPKTRVRLSVSCPVPVRSPSRPPRRPGAPSSRLHASTGTAPARDRRPDYRSFPCARPPTGAAPARDQSLPCARPDPPLRATGAAPAHDRSLPARLRPCATARFCFSGPNVYFGPILYFRPLLFSGHPFKARHV
jgi:hypothetical protein